MKMSSKVQDLVTKICQFTRASARKVLIWRVAARGNSVRAANRFTFVSETVESNGESANLYRKNRTTEVFYVRLMTPEEEASRAFADDGESNSADLV